MTSHTYGLNVSVVHSFYPSDQPSGENEAVRAEVDLLNRFGHSVWLSGIRTDDVRDWPGYRLYAAMSTATGRGATPLGDIHEHDADVVHVHNLFPNFGHTWTRRLKKPLVITLHNYRPVCAKATLFRDGKVCTDCIDGSRLSGLVHKCYRNKTRATLPLTVGQGLARRNLLERADRIIVLSDVQQDYYIRAGVPAMKMRVVPNFLPATLDGGAGPGGDAWLYAGRLSQAKGSDLMLEAWPNDIPLVVVGNPDNHDEMREVARGKQVEFRGNLDRPEVFRLMQQSRGLVFPSRWPETFGLVYLEALAAGTPVLATPPSAVAGFIARDGTGMSVPLLTPDVIRQAHEDFPGLRSIARRAFEQRYTEDQHIDSLIDVYVSAMRERQDNV